MHRRASLLAELNVHLLDATRERRADPCRPALIRYDSARHVRKCHDCLSGAVCNGGQICDRFLNAECSALLWRGLPFTRGLSTRVKA
jgi:hypothetical protein